VNILAWSMLLAVAQICYQFSYSSEPWAGGSAKPYVSTHPCGACHAEPAMGKEGALADEPTCDSL
jgi:hypothetical protein